MNTILEMENISKSYHGNKVLDVPHLAIKEKSIYGLIGPNGAGKSTLMKIILGLVQKDSGKVYLFDQEVNTQNQKDLNRYLGALIENPSFYDHLSAYDNLDIICTLKKINKKEIEKILDTVGLLKVKNRKVREYSLGMKQRMGIAMALIGQPKLLILDEPINGLDPYGIEEMRLLFQTIVKTTHTSILLSSHLLDEIEKIATHIGILQKGKFIYNGSLKDYREMYPPFISISTSDNKKCADLLEISSDHIKHNKLILGNLSNEDVANTVRFLHGKVDIYRITEEKESLEKLFIKETHGDTDEKH